MEKSKVQIFLKACGLSEDILRRKEFLREVLEYCKKSKNDSSVRTLIAVLNRAFKVVPGFRSFDLAVVKIQAQLLIPKLDRVPSLYEKIIEVWSSANSGLVDLVLDYISSLDDGYFQSLKKKIIQNQGHDEATSILDDFIKVHPQLEPNKSVYAFYCMTLFGKDSSDYSD